jgi:hypothetical protein
MSDRLEFTTNYNDLSTSQGFQFEFVCNRCGTGFRTRFQNNALGVASSAMDAANSLIGGFFGRAADMAERARSAAWQKAHDAAFVSAMEELKPDFIQCPRCSTWVCRKHCWNTDHGLCKSCAPDIAVEMAAAQAAKAQEKIIESATVSDGDAAAIGDSKTWKEGVHAGCPTCGAPLPPKVKFCPECGTKIVAKSYCSECGAELKPGAKFCAECGTKVT